MFRHGQCTPSTVGSSQTPAIPLPEGFDMPIDNADHTDRSRLADDGCPHISGDTNTFELLEFWGPFDDEIDDIPFSLSFESGGES